MTIVQAIILSVVEGITEFLPISSTGHMILVGHLLNISETDFVKSFEIIIQFGAILAIVGLYLKRILQNRKMWLPVILAFIPTGILGLTLYKLIKHYLLGNVSVVIWSLFLGGVVMIVLEKFVFSKTKSTDIAEKLIPGKSILIGFAQSLSMIPGISRSAATIFGGMGVGLSRKEAVEFSFILAIPTMFAATGLDLIKSGFSFSGQEYLIILIGFMGAFVSALLTVRWLVMFVQKNSFVVFGIYRIVLALVFLFLVK